MRVPPQINRVGERPPYESFVQKNKASYGVAAESKYGNYKLEAMRILIGKSGDPDFA